MIHRFHPGLHRVERTGFASGMHRNASSGSGRLRHRRRQLRFGELIRSREPPVHQPVFPRLINLDEVCAFLHLAANRFHELLSVVGVGRIRKHTLRRIEIVRVFVPAKNVDSVPADPQPRPGDLSRN